MTTIDQFLAALRAVECEPKQSGSGWTSRCPAHDDRNPSLSIRTGEDGRVLIHCHAGCRSEAIVSTVGLTMRDLMPDSADTVTKTPHQITQRQVSVTVTPVTPRKARIFKDADDALAELDRRQGTTHSHVWMYLNAEGNPVLKVARFSQRDSESGVDSKPGKTFRPIGRVADGWIIGDPPGKLPPYKLPELLKHDASKYIYVTEGEKAADAGSLLGFQTTTSAHGAKSARKTDWSPLAGKNVVILPDHDEAGERYADEVSELARVVGAKSIRIIRLLDKWPALPEGGDLADVFKLADPDETKTGIEELITAAEPEEPLVSAMNLAFEPFPTDALPEPVRTYVITAAKAICCDPAMVVLPVLSVLAASIGNSRVIQLKDSWLEPAILWTAVVAESGQAKTPAFSAALGPLRDAQIARIHDAESARERFEFDKAKYDRDYAQWKQSRGNEAPPLKPEEPRAVRLIVSDQTIEAVAVRLHENTRGLLLERDELIGWIAGFDKYKNGKGGDVAHWLSAWSAETMLVDRKTGQQTILIPRAALSVCGTIQPGTLKRVLGVQHRENGLIARVLFAMPTSRTAYWTEAGIPPDVSAQYASIVEDLLSLNMLETGEGLEPLKIRLSTEGKREFVRAHDKFVERTSAFTGSLAATASKLRAYLARFALIIHLIRCAAGDPTIANSDFADELSVRAAEQMANWFWVEAQRVHGRLTETQSESDQRQVIEWIKRQGGTCTVRSLTHGLRAYRGVPDEAKEALDRLALDGLGRWESPAPGTSGGRPSSKFYLNSARTDSSDSHGDS